MKNRFLLVLACLLCPVSAYSQEQAPTLHGPTLSIAGESLHLGGDKKETLKRLAAKCRVVNTANGVIVLDKENADNGCRGDAVFFQDDVINGVSRDEARNSEGYDSAATLYRMIGESSGKRASVRASAFETTNGKVKNILVSFDDGKEVVIQAVDSPEGNYMILRSCLGTCLK